MPRTGENIYRRNDGRREGRYVEARLQNGKTKYRSVYGKTYKMVRQKLREADGRRSSRCFDVNMTLNHYIHTSLEYKCESIDMLILFRYSIFRKHSIYRQNSGH